MDTVVYIFLNLCLLFCCYASSNSWSCSEPGGTYLTGEPYTPKGTITSINDLRLYAVNPQGSSKVLIGIHDIFGIDSSTTNMKQVADVLADGGYNVLLPDFFDGHPWEHANGCPNNDVNLVYKEWEEKNSWEGSVRPKLQQLLNDLKRRGYSPLGIFGFGYGGHKVAVVSAEFFADFQVACSFTAAPMFIAEAKSIRVPTLIIGYNNNTLVDYDDYCAIVETQLGDGSCVYKVYYESPGFVSSEGNWTVESTRLHAEEAVGKFKKFICQHLF